LKRKGIFTQNYCSECNKKIRVLNTYHHPISRGESYVCSDCWDNLNESETKYSKFISNSISKKHGGCTCYVLIKTFTNKEKFVYNELSKIQNILEINHLLGSYDIIIKMKLNDISKLDNLVTYKIRQIDGIKKTMTLTGAQSLKAI
jgi:DNA-binding Lrp family transcriptional regulator